MYSVGIDIGYGYCKVYNGVETKVFPTCVSAKVPETTFSELRPVFVKDQKYLVGEDAEREGVGVLKTTTADFVMSDAWLAVLGHALCEINSPPSGTIVLGIPPGMYTKKYANKVIEKVNESKVFVAKNGQEYVFKNYVIKIIPQGGGAFFSYVAGQKEDYKKNIAVIDIGHRTLDMIFFSKGKYVEGPTESVNIGTSTLLDIVKKELYKKYQININYSNAIELLKNGKLIILHEEYIPDNLQSAIKPYIQQIETFINDFFEKLPTGADIGLVAGGGVLALKGILQLKKKLTVVSNPEFANAIGYWHYAQNSWKSTTPP